MKTSTSKKTASAKTAQAKIHKSLKRVKHTKTKQVKVKTKTQISNNSVKAKPAKPSPAPTTSKFIAHRSALKEGLKAPAFKAQDQNGNWIDSDALMGKNIILYFYPKDDTPGCTKEACNLRDHYTTLSKQNYMVLGVSADNAKSHSKFAKKYNLPFSLLVDSDKHIIKAYDVWGKKQFMGRIYDGVLRNTFIINTKGIISKIIREVNTDAHSEQIINS